MSVEVMHSSVKDTSYNYWGSSAIDNYQKYELKRYRLEWSVFFPVYLRKPQNRSEVGFLDVNKYRLIQKLLTQVYMNDSGCVCVVERNYLLHQFMWMNKAKFRFFFFFPVFNLISSPVLLTAVSRPNFNSQTFATTNNLQLVAANFFRARFDGTTFV